MVDIFWWEGYHRNPLLTHLDATDGGGVGKLVRTEIIPGIKSALAGTTCTWRTTFHTNVINDKGGITGKTTHVDSSLERTGKKRRSWGRRNETNNE